MFENISMKDLPSEMLMRKITRLTTEYTFIFILTREDCYSAPSTTFLLIIELNSTQEVFSNTQGRKVEKKLLLKNIAKRVLSVLITI